MGRGGTRGTIFVMAHERTEAFDENDARLMKMLADFAAMGYKQQKQNARLMEQAKTAAAAQMAHELAHQINNPLQSITNMAYMVSRGALGSEQETLGSALLGMLTGCLRW